MGTKNVGSSSYRLYEVLELSNPPNKQSPRYYNRERYLLSLWWICMKFSRFRTTKIISKNAVDVL